MKEYSSVLRYLYWFETTLYIYMFRKYYDEYFHGPCYSIHFVLWEHYCCLLKIWKICNIIKSNKQMETTNYFFFILKIKIYYLFHTRTSLIVEQCWTNSSSQINKLLPTWSSVSTSARVTISTSFELVSSHARVTSIKFTKRESVTSSSSW